MKIKALSFLFTWLGIMAIVITWHVDSVFFRWVLVFLAIHLLRVGDWIGDTP